MSIRYGVVANIIASHAIARGSIPRVGMRAHLGIFLWALILNVLRSIECPNQTLSVARKVMQAPRRFSSPISLLHRLVLRDRFLDFPHMAHLLWTYPGRLMAPRTAQSLAYAILTEGTYQICKMRAASFLRVTVPLERLYDVNIRLVSPG